MADVKWIKIAVDMFENRKIKQLEAMPEGDALIVIWQKLLCLAGSINDNGAVYLTQNMPYSEESLAAEFRKPLNTVRLALATFERFNMIEVANDIIYITNWEKYQEVDKLSALKEYNRQKQREHRARQRALMQPNNKDVNDMSMTGQESSSQCQGLDIEEDIDIYNNINRYTDKLISPASHQEDSFLYSQIERIKKHIDENGLDYALYRSLNFYVAPYYYTMKLDAFICKQVNDIFIEDLKSYDKDKITAVLLYTLDWCIKCKPDNFMAYFNTAYKKNKKLYFKGEG